MLLFRLGITMAVVGLGLGGSFSAWQALAAAGDDKDQALSAQQDPTVQLMAPAGPEIVRVIAHTELYRSL